MLKIRYNLNMFNYLRPFQLKDGRTPLSLAISNADEEETQCLPIIEKLMNEECVNIPNKVILSIQCYLYWLIERIYSTA